MAKKDLLMGGMLKKIDDSNIFEKAETQIKNKIEIVPPLKELIPSLGKEEYEQLEANILAEGCREALILWENENKYILIDGHNRYEICQKHGIDFKILVKDFESMEAAKSFMINNQLGRRNLTPEQVSYLRGKRYESEKNKQGGIGENQYSKVAKIATLQNEESQGSKVAKIATLQNEELQGSKVAEFSTLQKTHEKLAQEYGISARTIMNDALFAKAIDKIGEVNPELKKEILSGKTKITKSQVQELAKMENLPSLETIEDLETLFQTDKNKVFDQLKTKKDHLVKIIKNNDFDLMSLEQIEKFCLDLVPKK